MIERKLWIVKDKCYKRISFGIDGIFAIRIYLNGFEFVLCYLNTNLKKYDVALGWNPLLYQKISWRKVDEFYTPSRSY